MNLDPASGPIKSAARERKRSRKRVGHYLFLILGSGAAAALVALVIAFIPTVIAFAFPAGSGLMINAKEVFPSVAPTHRVVDVYDPPPPSRPTSQPPAQPSANPTATPTTRPSPSPHQSPEPGDH